VQIVQIKNQLKKKNSWKNLLQQFYNREGIKLQKCPIYFAGDVHENTHEK
jgi:hypothetical protein